MPYPTVAVGDDVRFCDGNFWYYPAVVKAINGNGSVNLKVFPQSHPIFTYNGATQGGCYDTNKWSWDPETQCPDPSSVARG